VKLRFKPKLLNTGSQLNGPKVDENRLSGEFFLYERRKGENATDIGYSLAEGDEG
jgi:hypothetical protein